MAGVQFCVTTDYETAKRVVDDILIDQGFTLDYSDAYNMIAERGSKTATLLAGALAGRSRQHILLSVNYGMWDQGGQVVSVATANTGMAAGAIGASRVREGFIQLTAIIRAAFMQQGILAGEASF